MMRYTLATLLGGILFFAAGFVSHMTIGWHEAQIQRFADEDAVAKTIRTNAKVPGVYFLPQANHEDMAQTQKKMEQGPFLFAMVRPGSKPFNFPAHMAAQLGVDLLTAALVCLVIALSKNPCLGCRVAIAAAIGLASGVMSWLPYHNWYEMPWAWTLGSIAEDVARCALAGLAIGLVAPKPTAA